MVTITVEMTEAEALALAQFFKRAGHSDYRANAIGSDEAYEMMAGAEEIRKSLADAGFAPR
jgi:hypothetical protein